MNCLDSSVLVGYLDGDARVRDLLDSKSDEAFFAPTVVLHEVYFGEITERIPVAEIDENLNWLEALPFDRESAKQAAAIEDELEKRGEMIGRPDIQIAATVLTRGGTLITRDDHFERIDGLDVEHY
jgi:tRNA(fMet)-specific endonuclease VapC